MSALLATVDGGESRRRVAAGFTLLEMIVTLAIISVLVTYFAVQFVDSTADDDLRAAAADLRQAAQRASRKSSSYGSDFYLLLDRRGFGSGENSRGGEGDGGERVLEHVLPEKISLKLRRFGTEEGWVQPDFYPWGFPANGLSEPLAVRLEKGRAYVQLSFNALTGRVDEELSYFP